MESVLGYIYPKYLLGQAVLCCLQNCKQGGFVVLISLPPVLHEATVLPAQEAAHVGCAQACLCLER